MWKGLGYSVCIACSPVERQEHFFPLCQPSLGFSSQTVDFSAAGITSANASALHSASVMGTRCLVWVLHLTGCTEHPKMCMGMWGQACVRPGRAAPIGHMLSRLLAPCCMAPSVSPCTRYQLCNKCKCHPCILCRFLENRLAG